MRFKLPPRSPSPAPTRSTVIRDRQPKRGFGIVTTGKSYLDVRQALDDLGIDAAMPPRSASGSTRSA
jgi:indolepyruvate ferredoxin oxidoreductase